jgi:osomolarity two-component system sensor histidine kinase SLN1
LWNSPQENGPKDFQVRFVLPPNDTDHRHPSFSYPPHKSEFHVTQYPAVKKVLTSKTGSRDNAGYITSTTNEQGIKVAVGYAMPNTPIVDWAVIVEQSHSVVWQPINHLRDLLIICVFSVVGFLILLSVPVSHYSSTPIRRLRDATRKTVAPPKQLSDGHSPCVASVHQDNVISNFQIDSNATKRGFLARMVFWRSKTSSGPVNVELEQNHEFRIPCKVKDYRHLFRDELSDLTGTFNEMCDELMVNYERLEDRVKQRTAELEESKTAAEAANEMKTLFVANISHELKTPLNGIIGIAQIAQAEGNVDDLKRDMRTIYSQGDLLQKLIEDILSFRYDIFAKHGINTL